MNAIEVKVDNVNLIEVEFEAGQTDIEIAANFNPVVEVNDFDYPQELIYINQRISQILQAEGRLVEWNKSATHIQYRYAGDVEWVDYIPLSEIKGEKGDPRARGDLNLGVNDSPEFANVQIPALNTTAETGGEITPTLWAWIQSVYVDIIAKSVKSHVIGIWNAIRNQNRLLIDITITQEVSVIDISTDSNGDEINIKEGEIIRITGYFPTYAPLGISNYLGLRINNITQSIYASGSAFTSQWRNTLGDRQNIFTIEIELIDGFAHMHWVLERNLNGSYASVIISGFTSERINFINSIQFMVYGSALVRVGSRIKIKHIKSNS